MRISFILLLCIIALLIYDACAGKNTPNKANKKRAHKKIGNNGTPFKQAAAAGNQNKNMPKTTTNGQSPKKAGNSGASPSRSVAAGNQNKNTPETTHNELTPKKTGNSGASPSRSVAAGNQNKNMPKSTHNELTPKKAGNSGASPSRSVAAGNQNKNTPETTHNELTPKKATLKPAKEHDDMSIGAEVKDAPQHSTPKKILRAATVGGLLLLSGLAGQPITAGAYEINQGRPTTHMTEADHYRQHSLTNNMANMKQKSSNPYGESAALNKIHGQNNNMHVKPNKKDSAAKTKPEITHNNFSRHTRTRNPPPPPPPHKKTPNFSALAAERAKQKKEDEVRMNNKVENEYNEFFEDAETKDVYQAQPQRYNNVPTNELAQDIPYNNFHENREHYHHNHVPMPQDNFGNSFDEYREYYQNLNPTRHGTVVPVKQNSVNPIDKSQLGHYHNRQETYPYESNPRGVETRNYGDQRVESSNYVDQRDEQNYANTLDESEKHYYPKRPTYYDNQKEDQLTQDDNTYVHDGQNYPQITQAPPPPRRTQVFHAPHHQNYEPTSYNLCGPNWNKFGHYCYLVSTNPSGKPISFDEANKECKYHNPNAQLASIHSPMEDDFVAALTKNRPFRSQTQGQSLYWLAQMKSAVEHPNSDMDGNYGNEGSSSNYIPFKWTDDTPVDYGNPTDKKSGKNFPWYTKPSTKYLENNPGVVMYGKKKSGSNNPWMDEKHTGTWSAISTQSATHGKSVPDVHGYVCKMRTMKHHMKSPPPPPNDEPPHFTNDSPQYGLGWDNENENVDEDEP
ncbi:hypothetical protein niasHT_029808 [Heterodera trifolii]|uniref:C-type lectin domain-containing protein n=1 Tax=Heterodera trifolii TaxID=157864 RepID=A0ABD2K399_9BILA